MVIALTIDTRLRYMKKTVTMICLLGALLFSSQAIAQQSQDFGDYVVHYNALNTNLIPPQVAQGYGIQCT